MNKNYFSDQSGRSMVEMLGVLAIIGVLSIGGISGYSKAMAKYRVNKTLDQISMLVMNIRSMYSANTNYAGLGAQIAIQMGIIPNDMLAPGANRSAASKIYNAYQGVVQLAPGGANNQQFTVTYAGLPKEACVTIATADWGSQAGSGLLSIAVGPNGANKETPGAGNTAHTVDALPLPLSTAAAECSNVADAGNTIIWTYY